MPIKKLRSRWKNLNSRLNVKVGERYQGRNEKYALRAERSPVANLTGTKDRPLAPKVDSVAGSEFI